MILSKTRKPSKKKSIYIYKIQAWAPYWNWNFKIRVPEYRSKWYQSPIINICRLDTGWNRVRTRQNLKELLIFFFFIKLTISGWHFLPNCSYLKYFSRFFTIFFKKNKLLKNRQHMPTELGTALEIFFLLISVLLWIWGELHDTSSLILIVKRVPLRIFFWLQSCIVSFSIKLTLS